MMEKLTLKSTIKSSKYGDKSIEELIKIKGAIFSMIKDGYDFDDEVLEAAHIRKQISNEKVYCRVGGDNSSKKKKLPKDTQSIKQIIYELNMLENKFKCDNLSDDKDDAWSKELNNVNIDDNDN
jgi:hypothetical protein|nr:MAG TPA: hypothetical protein [Ackermannviridae sp.]